MPSDEMVEKVARAICKSNSGDGWRCCQWPAQGGRWNCTAKTGAYDDGARAALAAAEAGEPVASGDEEAQCYPVHLAWSEEDEAWIATSPDLPGCCAVGDSRQEAVREMQDAIFSWIDAAKEAGRSIPKATLSKPPEWARPSPPSEASRDERAAIRKEAFEEAAKIARIEAAQCASLGCSHPENSQNRDRLFARARSADAIATAIRARGEA